MKIVETKSEFNIGYFNKDKEEMGVVNITVTHEFPIIRYPFHNLISAYTLHQTLKTKGYRSSIISCYILQLRGGDGNFTER